MQISWQHIISVLDYDLDPARVAPGFRQTKLTPEHVFLQPRSRMNVSLAAQVNNEISINGSNSLTLFGIRSLTTEFCS